MSERFVESEIRLAWWMMALMFSCLPAPTQSQSSNVCSSSGYTILSGYDRSNTYSGQMVRCDSQLRGWYRFMGAAGARMPTFCVAQSRCGTHGTGWMQGLHPTIQQGTVYRQICFHWNGNCCNYRITIRVKNCGGYYVYELRAPPACHLRYCGYGTGQTPVQPRSECTSYSILNSHDRSQAVTRGYVPKCDLSLHGWYRFEGAAGTQMPEFCVPTERCGAHAPGWMRGIHPTEHEGIVTRQVCYHWEGLCCKWRNNIRVKNCGGFYVYELVKPPECPLRYCGNGKTSPRQGSSTGRSGVVVGGSIGGGSGFLITLLIIYWCCCKKQ